MKKKRKGAPPRPRLNVRASPEEIQAERDDPHSIYNWAGFADTIDDGKGIDYRLPLPPWDERTREQICDNLAILRVDPNHSNSMQHEICIVRTIAKSQEYIENISEEYIENQDIHLGAYMYELLSEWGADTAKKVFADIVRMKQKAEDPPHRNFLAYRAYRDFLLEFGFEPTRKKLAKFILKHTPKYPVGLKGQTSGKPWWDMFFDAGLSRLEE